MTSDKLSDDERTTAFGLFNFAESYWNAAAALRKVTVNSSHAESPVYLLYFHAVELYLKSFLRMHGHSPTELQKKFGHQIKRIKNRAKKLGLTFNGEDEESILLMHKTDAIIRSRYLQTGFVTWPTLTSMEKMCRRLRQQIGAELKKADIPVRL